MQKLLIVIFKAINETGNIYKLFMVWNKTDELQTFQRVMTSELFWGSKDCVFYGIVYNKKATMLF